MNLAALPDNRESSFVSNASAYLLDRSMPLSFLRKSLIGLDAVNPSVGPPIQIISNSLSEDGFTSFTFLQTVV